MKKVKLVTDYMIPKLEVTTTVYEVEEACRRVLGWRTPTKRYDSIFARYKMAGSTDYDKVIKYIYDKKEDKIK